MRGGRSWGGKGLGLCERWEGLGWYRARAV